MHEWVLDDIPLEKQRGYSQQMQARRPVKSKQIRDTTAAIELVFFLRITLLELSDSAVYQSGRRVSDLVRSAFRKTQAKQARSSITYRERLLSIRALVNDTNVPAEDRLVQIGEMLADIGDKPTSSHAAHVRETLVEDGIRVRNLLHSLDGLTLEGRTNDDSLANLGKLKELYAGKITELPTDQEFATDKAWSDLVNEPDRKRALRALEAATMMGLRKGLRRGSVWVSHSLSYRERDQMLIPPKMWDQERDRHLSILELPKDPDAFLEPLLKHIEAGLAAVAEAAGIGKVNIDADGTIHLTKLEALPDETTPKRTLDLMFKEIGYVQQPDLMLEMDAHTNFSEVLLGRRAKDEHELIALYAALIGENRENGKNRALSPVTDS